MKFIIPILARACSVSAFVATPRRTVAEEFTAWNLCHVKNTMACNVESDTACDNNGYHVMVCKVGFADRKSLSWTYGRNCPDHGEHCDCATVSTISLSSRRTSRCMRSAVFP
ncbi:hypothetical protein BCR34DRAFT_588655 [Clohesyomyces aquaticus]|uniref:Uncharacterized protein n=1 Tax=Clohesyomyces aquaticus TaxID=1231657 RepID=A0A1Y1ZKH0_9PLEO|nr:hypothetical protein BCR34DRAFT_588655 [Clohesyomyces aquaticus]